MTLRTIITYKDPRLRKKSIRVKRIDSSIQSLIDDMIETMRSANGVGLAAPQVGVLLRVIVAEYTDEDTEELHQTILVNPEIAEREGEWMAEEGCLSIPGFVGTVPRAEKVTVRGKSRDGKAVKLKADGYLAHILQHEIDHLEGTLYVDYLEHGFEDLRPVDPDRPRRRRRGESEEIDEISEAERANVGDPTAPIPAAAEEAAEEPSETPQQRASSGRQEAYFDPCCAPSSVTGASHPSSTFPPPPREGLVEWGSFH